MNGTKTFKDPWSVEKYITNIKIMKTSVLQNGHGTNPTILLPLSALRPRQERKEEYYIFFSLTRPKPEYGR